MLIVSLPPVYLEKLMIDIISHPLVDAVRYNTGMDSPLSPKKTMSFVVQRANKFKKTLYVDIKGKQLRIVKWASPPYGPIILNHKVKAFPPAKVYFRGDDCCELKAVKGNKIYVDPLPKYAVGQGQAVNIVGKNVEVEDGLTNYDYEYVRAALDNDIHQFMLSFVDSFEYIGELEEVIGNHPAAEEHKIVLKIESQKGLDFALNESKSLRDYQLMAARDDLMIQLGLMKTHKALAGIVSEDPEAICASRLLMGLEQTGSATLADISDLQLMHMIGYKHFMFSDGISRNHFKEAIQIWQEFKITYPYSA